MILSYNRYKSSILIDLKIGNVQDFSKFDLEPTVIIIFKGEEYTKEG